MYCYYIIWLIQQNTYFVKQPQDAFDKHSHLSAVCMKTGDVWACTSPTCYNILCSSFNMKYFANQGTSKSTLCQSPLWHMTLPGRFSSRLMTFEFSWYVTVQFTDHLVDRFLPRWIAILAHRNGNIKFSQRNLSNLHKPVRDLSPGEEKKAINCKSCYTHQNSLCLT